MPRHRRLLLDGYAYHVLNRGNRRQTIFRKPADYQAFLEIVLQACARFSMPLVALCVMRNHWHLVLWPERARSISEYMHWLLNVHVHRYHLHYGLRGQGHLYQDRYKAFPIQDHNHLCTVLCYVEANPLRAQLVRRAEQWEWSSLRLRSVATWRDLLSGSHRVLLPDDWGNIVNNGLTREDLRRVRVCARTGNPYGSEAWVKNLRKLLQKK